MLLSSFSHATVLELLPAPTGARGVPPNLRLAFGLAVRGLARWGSVGQTGHRHGCPGRRSQRYIGLLLAGELPHGVDDLPHGVALELPHLPLMGFPFSLGSGPPLVKLAESNAQDRGSGQERVVKIAVTEVNSTAHEQSTRHLDSLEREMGQHGVCQLLSDGVVFLLVQQVKANGHGQVGVNAFQGLIDIATEMLRRPGEYLGDGL
jgi:hypothetical protein